MKTEHQFTREQEAYERFLDEIWEMLSVPARAMIEEAQSTAYAAHMVRSYCYQPEEYDEAMDRMRLAAAGLTDRERELLAKLWHLALAAAASVDANDYETLTGYRVYRHNLHWYYRMSSGMVEEVLGEILREKREAEIRKELAEREPDDFSDIPF